MVLAGVFHDRVHDVLAGGGWAGIVGTLLADGSSAQAALGIIGASVSGIFLLVIGILSLVSFLQAARLWRASRSLPVGDDEIEDVGFYIVGLFIVIWAVAPFKWKRANRRSRTAWRPYFSRDRAMTRRCTWLVPS